LDENIQQQAREAEILRLIKEKATKEKQEAEEREKLELKLMRQYDNFYTITSKMLGGGAMSLEKRLFRKNLKTDSTSGNEYPSRNNSAKASGRGSSARIASAPNFVSNDANDAKGGSFEQVTSRSESEENLVGARETEKQSHRVHRKELEDSARNFRNARAIPILKINAKDAEVLKINFKILINCIRTLDSACRR
jgi:hypothetical protein